MSQPPELEPIFDRTPHPFGDGPVDPVVYDASMAALRQRTVNFAAQALCRHDVWSAGWTAKRRIGISAARGDGARRAGCAAGRPPASRPRWSTRFAAGTFVHRDGRRRPPRHRTWNDPAFERPVVGRASPPGYGSILLRPARGPGFDPQADRAASARCRQRLAAAAMRSTRRRRRRQRLAAALDAFFAGSPGAYGVLIASPERVLVERYSAFGATGSRDAKLVDDQGDHLHGHRPADP